MLRNLNRPSIHVTGAFFLLLLAYHLIFRNYFPLPNGRMGHDYVLTLTGLLDGYLWFRNNGFSTPPWFTPSFCGGQTFFADPQSAFYSIPQFLTFIIDPVQAVYWAFLMFASVGFWGMYLYCRRCLVLDHSASMVGACVFMFNGFYVHRMIVGHYGYQSFMLLPLIAYSLLKPTNTAKLSGSDFVPSLFAGILTAYCFHSGLTTLMLPAALSVLALACLSSLSRHAAAKTFVFRGIVAMLITIGLCASKLNANLSLMKYFARDYYPLPGISDTGGLLSFVFQSLFYSSEHAYQTVTPLWKNLQWAAMPHELAYGLTPITLFVLIAGTGIHAINRSKGVAYSHGPLAAYYVLLPIVLLPLALLLYTPDWNAFLKKIPLIGSTTSPFRWLIIYIPILAALSAIVTNSGGKWRTYLTGVTLLGIPLLSALENRDFYEHQDYNPTAIITYYDAVKSGKLEPHIRGVGNPPNGDGQANHLFLEGISPIQCYNPIFGYRQERFVSAPLVAGSVEMPTSENYLNIHNPACFVFPNENKCRPWDAFTEKQRVELDQFTNYKPYNFNKSQSQYIADLITELTIGFVVLTLGSVLLRSRR